MKSRAELEIQARRYLISTAGDVNSFRFLGDGTDGAVWTTNRGTAVKAYQSIRGYANERDSYERLAAFGITEKIAGFWLPEMVGWNDGLMAIEMDFMQDPPYVVDFAKVRIDRPPDFSEDVLRQAEAQGREQFGRNWPRVQALMAELESYQIYYLDPKPSNIVFPPD